MKTMYRLSGSEIQQHAVVRETAKTVTYQQQKLFGKGMYEAREMKRARFASWHDTWESAHAERLANAEQRVASLTAQLESAKERLDRIRKVTKPENAA